MTVLLGLLRGVVFAVFVFSGLVAVGAWAVRTRRIEPSSGAGKTIRRVVDPLLLPVERWLLQRGQNPQMAGWWLLGFVVIAGIVVISVAQWLLRQTFRFATVTGPFDVIQLVVYYAGQVILIALIVRVIGTWFGLGRFNRWTGWAYRVTDWIVVPLGRVIPPLGIIDVTPIVAWFGILIFLSWFMTL